MADKHRIQTGCVIIEIVDDRPEYNDVYLTVSKESYDNDAVQVRLPGNIAEAIGKLLIGEE